MSTIWGYLTITWSLFDYFSEIIWLFVDPSLYPSFDPLFDKFFHHFFIPYLIYYLIHCWIQKIDFQYIFFLNYFTIWLLFGC